MPRVFVPTPLDGAKVFERGSVSYNGRRIEGVIRRLLLRATLLARQRSKGGIPSRQESAELLPVAGRWQAERDDSARKLAGTMRRRCHATLHFAALIHASTREPGRMPAFSDYSRLERLSGWRRDQWRRGLNGFKFFRGAHAIDRVFVNSLTGFDKY